MSSKENSAKNVKGTTSKSVEDVDSLDEMRKKFRKGSAIKHKPDPQPYRDIYSKSSVEVQLKHLAESDLFKKISISDDDLSSSKAPSMLIHGFTLRNLKSLQDALAWQKRKRTKEERQEAMREVYEEERRLKAEREAAAALEAESQSSTTNLESISQVTTTAPSETTKDRINYLMGLTDDQIGEEEVPFSRRILPPPSDEGSESVTTGTYAMRRARKYLRTHKIFEFFQYLTAHLLSASPENPISFLLDLLDKCLIYRSGLGCPPVLYEIPHLEQLFFLMDRMRTGFIEVAQYNTGMHTLGICSYNKSPPLSPDGMVSKETFITEAYDCLTDLLNDMIRVRKESVSLEELPQAPPPSIIFKDTSSALLSVASMAYHKDDSSISLIRPQSMIQASVMEDIEKLIEMRYGTGRTCDDVTFAG